MHLDHLDMMMHMIKPAKMWEWSRIHSTFLQGKVRWKNEINLTMIFKLCVDPGIDLPSSCLLWHRITGSKIVWVGYFPLKSLNDWPTRLQPLPLQLKLRSDNSWSGFWHRCQACNYNKMVKKQEKRMQTFSTCNFVKTKANVSGNCCRFWWS